MTRLQRPVAGRGRGARLQTRRTLLVSMAGLVGLAACTLPPVTPRTPIRNAQVGYVAAGTPGGPNSTAFVQGLKDLGWIEGQNLVMQYRWASTGSEREFATLVTELLELRVNVIVTTALRAAQAALQATETTPIVMTSIGDPVGNGLVPRLNRPGKNATGISIMAPQLSGKRLELLKEALGSPARVGVLYNPSVHDMVLSWMETERAATHLGIELVPLRILAADEIEAAFGLAASQNVEGLIVLSDDVVFPLRARIMERALAARLPAMGPQRPYAVAGALLSYGPNYADLYRRAAAQVNMILNGTEAGSIPVEQPMTFDFVVNATTAQALGIILPGATLLAATEVVQ